MLLELGLAVAAAYGADKLGLVNLGGGSKRTPRSTAPVQSAQTAGMLVAPSIPGHVVPAPAPVDLKAADASGGISGSGFDTGLLASVSAALQQSSGAGAPYVDPMGYWRDFSSGALYQFHDPNTGAPMGRPGYMPLRYKQYADAQDAAQATQAAIAAGGADQTAADTMTAVKTGVQIAGAAATVAAAAAGGGSAAGTAAAVAGVAGSIAACLGPLPVAPEEGWHELHGQLLRAFDGDRALQVAMTRAPDGSGVAVLAAEVAADAVLALPTATATAAARLYQDHAHELVGVFASEVDAANEAEAYVKHWRARRQRNREAARCACEAIVKEHARQTNTRSPEFRR